MIIWFLRVTGARMVSKAEGIAAGLERGFTLIEVAVVVFIITLLLGSLLVPLTTQVDQRKITDTRKVMNESLEALIGFALSNGRLPCPDNDGDGLEDVRTVADNLADGCKGAKYSGWLPWATLAVPQTDAWGNRLKYRVTNDFTRRTGDTTASACPAGAGADPNACTLELADGSSGDMQIKSRDPVTKAEIQIATGVPAVIISFGKNGYGGTSDSGAAQPAPPAGDADETANGTAATTAFYGRQTTPTNSTCSDTAAGQAFCEFDDMIVWIATPILLNRMVAAGKLP